MVYTDNPDAPEWLLVTFPRGEGRFEAADGWRLLGFGRVVYPSEIVHQIYWRDPSAPFEIG